MRAPGEIPGCRALARCAVGALLALSPGARAEELKKEVAELQAIAEAVRAPGAELDVPCVTRAASSCGKHALSHAFAALERLEGGKAPSEPVRVAVFGNSLISADGVIGFLRKRLVDRFGDGGRGLVLADRMGPWGPRVRTGFTRGGWELTTVGMLQMPKLPHGVAGAQHQASAKNARTRYELNAETRAELLWFSPVEHKGLRLEVDGKPYAAFFPLRPLTPLRASISLPEQAKVLDVVADAPGPVVQGVVLERRTGGVVVDTLGVPSVDATLFMRTDEAAFVQQLKARAPALVTVMLGGNEVKRLAWRRATLDIEEADLRNLLRRAREAAPQASCLVVSPIDSVRGPSNPKPFEERAELAHYLAMQRRVAGEAGCAYFDLFGAMGGTGSLKRFAAKGFVHDDLVHPRGKGLNLLGELLASALLRAYDGRQAQAPSGELAGARETR